MLETPSASDAYRWACEVAISIVISDVELSGNEDGFSLARRLKADRRIQSVPVLLLVDCITDDVRKAASDAGCHLVATRASEGTLLPLINGLISRRSTAPPAVESSPVRGQLRDVSRPTQCNAAEHVPVRQPNPQTNVR